VNIQVMLNQKNHFFLVNKKQCLPLAQIRTYNGPFIQKVSYVSIFFR
jgi:hypothetical protein